MLVVFLLPLIPWTPSDADGPMDIGPLYASVYPAVQSFMVAARALGIGTALTTVIRIHTAELLRGARRAGWLRDRRARADGAPGRPLRRGAPQAGRGGHPLEPLRHEAPLTRRAAASPSPAPGPARREVSDLSGITAHR